MLAENLHHILIVQRRKCKPVQFLNVMLQIDINLAHNLIGELHSAALHTRSIFLIAYGADHEKRNRNQQAEQYDKLGAQRHIYRLV